MVKRVLNEQQVLPVAQDTFKSKLKDKLKSTTQNIGGEIKGFGKKVKQKINNRNIDWSNIKSGELNNDNFEGYIKWLEKEGYERSRSGGMMTPEIFIENNPQKNNPIYFIEKPETIPGAANTMLRGSIKLAKGKSKPLFKMSKDKTSEHDILQRWFFIK